MHRVYLSVIIYVCVAMIGWSMDVIPDYREWQHNKKRYDALSHIHVHHDEASSSDTFLNIVYPQFPFLRIVTETVAQSGLTLVNLKTNAVHHVEGVDSMVVQMKMRGHFSDFYAWTQMLSRYPILLQSIHLHANNPDEIEMQLQLQGWYMRFESHQTVSNQKRDPFRLYSHDTVLHQENKKGGEYDISVD